MQTWSQSLFSGSRVRTSHTAEGGVGCGACIRSDKLLVSDPRPLIYVGKEMVDDLSCHSDAQTTVTMSHGMWPDPQPGLLRAPVTRLISQHPPAVGSAACMVLWVSPARPANLAHLHPAQPLQQITVSRPRGGRVVSMVDREIWMGSLGAHRLQTGTCTAVNDIQGSRSQEPWVEGGWA